MAKRSGGPNKSEAIRVYLEGNPSAKPKEIVAHLQSKGIDVTPAFVSTIKSKLLSSGQLSGGEAAPAPTKRGRPKGAGRKKVTRRGRPKAAAAAPKAAAPAKGDSGSVSIDGIVLAKKLADQLGGVDKARAALAALEKITG